MKIKENFRFFLKKAPTVWLCAAGVWLTGCGNQPMWQDTFYTMDTVVTLTLPESDANATRKSLEVLSQQLDCYADQGALAALNASGTSQDADLRDVISQTILLEDRFGTGVQLSSGALSRLWGITSEHPRVPTDADRLAALETLGDDRIRLDRSGITLPADMQLDLGAVAKGYALDQTAQQWQDAGIAWGILSLRSSVLLYGSKPGGEDFTVQIQDPNGTDILGTVTTPACFLSTSGGYERFFEADGVRYCHILDLTTGRPTETDLTSVTVFTDNGLKSDFLSTLLFLEGSEHLEPHLHAADYQVLAVDAAGKIYCSDGLQFQKAGA